MKAIRALFFLIFFLIALGWALGEIHEWLEDYSITVYLLESANITGKVNYSVFINETNYTADLTILMNHSLDDRFQLNNEILITSDLLPFIIQDEEGERFEDLVLKGLSLSAREIRPKQYQVLENLSGIFGAEYVLNGSNRSCVSYTLNPFVFDEDLEGYKNKTLNLTYCLFTPAFFDVPYTPSANITIGQEKHVVSTSVVKGIADCDLDIQGKSASISYSFGVSIDGKKYYSSSESKSLGEGVHVFTGGYYKGYGPLAKITITITKENYCSDWENGTCINWDWKYTGGADFDYKTITFEKAKHTFPMQIIFYNGSSPVYLKVEGKVIEKNEYANSLVDFNETSSFAVSGYTSQESDFSQYLWSYETGKMKYELEIYDNISVFNHTVTRKYHVGNITVEFYKEGETPEWGENTKIYSKAEILDYNLLPVPEWIFESQEIDESYVDLYMQYQVYRWTSDRIQEFVNNTISVENSDKKGFQVWWLASQLPLQMNVTDRRNQSDNSSLPVYALMKKEGTILEVDYQFPFILSFTHFLREINSTMLWDQEGDDFATFNTVVTYTLLDDIDENRIPEDFVIPRIESDEGVILPSEMAIQSSQIAVWVGYNSTGWIKLIDSLPEPYTPFDLYKGWRWLPTFKFDVKEKEAYITGYESMIGSESDLDYI
jgi:hypothetical protein